MTCPESGDRPARSAEPGFGDSARLLRARPFAAWVRDLHLYAGLFVSPFVLAFALSVFFLVHNWLPKPTSQAGGPRTVSELPLPTNLAQLSGRERIDALRPALERAQVRGEVDWIQQQPNRLIVPVTVPGHLTTVTIDLIKREAVIQEQTTGLASALVTLHKSPGPHLVNIRMNWAWMCAWFWLADATVYLLMFLTLSGVYLWVVLHTERRTGLVLLAAGAVCFFGLVYGLVH